MAGSGKNWLIGCGIGCGTIIVIAALAGTFAFKALKGVDAQMEGVEESMAALTDQYGDRFAYEPQIDGAVPYSRMEVFLAVRESAQPAAVELSGILEQIEGDASAFKKARLWLELVPAMVTYGSERTEAMLAEGMGVGEYQYIYALAFFNVLENDPSDGPSFVMNGSDDESDSQVQVRFGSDDEEDVREERSERVRMFFNDSQRAVLKKQIEAYQATLSTDADWTAEDWGAQLFLEKEAMDLESVRMLWEDGLPDHIRSSITPFYDRLAETYFPLINPVDLGLSDLD